MPPKAKKKRASLKLDSSGEIKDAVEEPRETPVRQVVEVVEEADIPEAIETIKRDTEEIEDAVETIEEVTEKEQQAPPPVVEEEIPGDKRAVEALFTKSQSPVNPEITVVGKRGPSLGVWVGAMLGVALAIGVSLILLVRGPKNLPFLAPQPTPTPSPTMAPSPTPSPAVSRSDIKVSVLNGGGVVGAGSKMKTFLEDKGYTVVSVGNAKEYTYTDTEILVKSDKEEYRELLTSDLKSEYSLGTSSGTVDGDEDYDVQVIVGKEE